MHAVGIVLAGMFAGVFMATVGALCFVFNRRLGGWLRRLPLAALGLRPKVEVDETIFRGLACLAGLLYAGMGLAFLAGSLR